MKFETIFRRLFDTAHLAYQDNADKDHVQQAMGQELRLIHNDLPDSPLVVGFSPVIARAEGPLVTAHLFTSLMRPHRFKDLTAAAILRVRSNHRVIAMRYRVLGKLGKEPQEEFDVFYVEGAAGQAHRPIPPFALGDLSKTNQALKYLATRKVLGNHPQIAMIGNMLFPPLEGVEDCQHLFGEWPTDALVFSRLLQLQAA